MEYALCILPRQCPALIENNSERSKASSGSSLVSPQNMNMITEDCGSMMQGATCQTKKMCSALMEYLDNLLYRSNSALTKYRSSKRERRLTISLLNPVTEHDDIRATFVRPDYRFSFFDFFLLSLSPLPA
jgi:hypothetical protein